MLVSVYKHLFTVFINKVVSPYRKAMRESVGCKLLYRIIKNLGKITTTKRHNLKAGVCQGGN